MRTMSVKKGGGGGTRGSDESCSARRTPTTANAGPNCGSQKQVQIESRTAGRTYHYWDVGVVEHRIFKGTVSPDSPSRRTLTGASSVGDWRVTGQVVEYRAAVCVPRPL